MKREPETREMVAALLVIVGVTLMICAAFALGGGWAAALVVGAVLTSAGWAGLE